MNGCIDEDGRSKYLCHDDADAPIRFRDLLPGWLYWLIYEWRR